MKFLLIAITLTSSGCNLLHYTDPVTGKEVKGLSPAQKKEIAAMAAKVGQVATDAAATAIQGWVSTKLGPQVTVSGK